jgi:hypothetical protein
MYTSSPTHHADTCLGARHAERSGMFRRPSMSDTPGLSIRAAELTHLQDPGHAVQAELAPRGRPG